MVLASWHLPASSLQTALSVAVVAVVVLVNVVVVVDFVIAVVVFVVPGGVPLLVVAAIVVIVVVVVVVVAVVVIVVVGHASVPGWQAGTSLCVGHCLADALLAGRITVIVLCAPLSHAAVHLL